MSKGGLVVDGVVHAYTSGDQNRLPSGPLEVYAGLVDWIQGFLHVLLKSREPGYLPSRPELAANWHADDLANVFFEESDIDLIAYHGGEVAAFFARGSSSWPIVVELKRRQARHEECPVDEQRLLGAA